MVPDYYFYVDEGRLYRWHFHAHGLGASGIDNSHLNTAYLFAGFDRTHEYRGGIHNQDQRSVFRRAAAGEPDSRGAWDQPLVAGRYIQASSSANKKILTGRLPRRQNSLSHNGPR